MIGFIGGTGPEGRGLALRFALAGEDVVIGSRDESRATKAAERILADAPGASVYGALNSDICGVSSIVFITVPYPAQRQTLEEVRDRLAGKIVVDVVAPLAFSDGVARAIPVAEGSAALEARAILTDATVVGAFQTISAHDLLVPGRLIDSDVVVCTDDSRAKQVVMALAEKIRGVRAMDGGGLDNAGYVENLAALLLNINKLYKARSAIKIVGI